MSRLARLQQRLASRFVQTDICDLLALTAFAILAVLVLLTFDDYAISNDETVQHRYAELVIAYYASGFTDLRVFSFDNLYLYGALFDLTSILIERMTGLDLFDIRHLLCALTGIGGIAATWALARLIAGPRAGLIALLALAVCGPWYGTMFNHTKDVPFAAAMIGATYFLFRGARDLPRPRIFDVLMFGLLLGCALGLRATGLLMVGYAGLLVLLRLPALPDWRKRGRFAGTILLRALPAFVLAYLIMIAVWPWAFLEPLNPVRAIFAFAHFNYAIQTMAFGQIYEMYEVPRWYIPVYLAIKLPLTVLSGALLAIGATIWAARREGLLGNERQRALFLLTFMALFPVLCHVAFKGPAFTGMRHFIFVVPPLAVLAGIGFDMVLKNFESRGRLLGASALAGVAGAFLVNTVTLVQLHPYEYLFFNPLISGLEGASRRFDMDYWSSIVPEAVDSLEAFLNQKERSTPGAALPRYTVGVCAERESFEYEAKDDRRLVWVDEWEEADFFISSTQMDCDKRMAGETIATIQRFGVPIGVVKDRRAIVRLDISRTQRPTFRGHAQ
jgi:hypothetical protein